MAQVQLDRKTLWVLAVGVLVIALLVFFAGYLVGLNSALAEAAESDEPVPPAAVDPAVREAPEEVPGIPVRSPEDPVPPEPEPYSDEPVPLDDSDPPLQEPPPREPPPQVVEESSPAGEFTVQLGAFREDEHAQNLQAELLDLGMEPEVDRLEDPVLGVLYKVRLGRYATFDEARDVAQQIRVEAGHDAWAVRLD